jgi:hypothetical protein
LATVSQRVGSGHNNSELSDQNLEGDLILEVPIQRTPVPQQILDFASERDVIIRDEKGRILNPLE